MFEGLLRLFSSRPPLQILRDTFDVLVVAFVIYRALLVVRGTRAMQMAAGLVIVFLVYLGSNQLGLVTLHSILSAVLSRGWDFHTYETWIEPPSPWPWVATTTPGTR